MLAIGCASRAPTKPTLADLHWLEGSWHSERLDSRWQVVNGVMWGVALNDRGFEVNIVDRFGERADAGPLTLLSIVDGKAAMRFGLDAATPGELRFAGATGTVRVTKTAAGWRGQFTPPNGAPEGFDMTARELVSAPELEDADRSFAVDTARSGVAGWLAAFAPDGALWRAQGRVEHDGIAAEMTPLLASGKLTWQPHYAGRRAEVGFTLGTWAYADGKDVASGSYVTIWKHQPDGSWKVVFDIGRPSR